MTSQKTKKTLRDLLTLKERWELQQQFYEAGVIPALYDALVVARDSGCEPPDWAIDAAIKVVADRIKSGFTKGKGTTGNELNKFRQAIKHYRRWNAVKKLLEKHIPWSKVYFDAEDILHGTISEGKSETIKKSYQRVNKDLKDPLKALQYYHACHEVRKLTNTLF